MSTAIQTVADRIESALEYLTHEISPERAIAVARNQLVHAQVSLAAARAPLRRREDAVPLTFRRADDVPRNPWPPIETDEGEARSFTEVQELRGRQVVAYVETLLEQLP